MLTFLIYFIIPEDNFYFIYFRKSERSLFPPLRSVYTDSACKLNSRRSIEPILTLFRFGLL